MWGSMKAPQEGGGAGPELGWGGELQVAGREIELGVMTSSRCGSEIGATSSRCGSAMVSSGADVDELPAG
jgi:hypothetical protein